MGRTPLNSRLRALAASSLFIVGAVPLAWARDLSLDERVAAQKAIEQVYWSHRIWPEANPGPKPALSAVLTDAAIAAKVEVALGLTARLDANGERLVTGEKLQAEILRMARQTKAPATLRELFAALHDDPFLIAECLARPALAARLPATERASAPLQTPDSRAIEPPRGGYSVRFPVVGCADDSWEVSSLTTATGPNLPAARQLHTAVWTGAEIIVWGGWNGSVAFANGGSYDPATDSWANSTLTTGTGANVPPARYRHTAIWTGTEMIVWGGRNSAGTPLGSGGGYNPTTDTWTLSSLTNATGAHTPSPRVDHTAVWTGTEMIVWGGRDASGIALDNGGKYNPAVGVDSWAVSTLTNATGSFVPAARYSHTAVWTGTSMIVWGGSGTTGSPFNNGGRFDPSPGVDAWDNSSLTNATGSFVPGARNSHTAVWTGTEMIVWGGAPTTNTGGRYSPSTDSWALSSLTNATGANVPTGRQLHTAVWTGTEMIVWGGSTDGSSAVLDTGGRYSPRSDSWALSTLTTGTGANVASARQFHTALWTGLLDHRMVVWGGSPNTATGGLYCAICTPITWYADADGDGYGNSAATQSNCIQPAGYVATGGDCNDTSPAIHPGAAEACNGVDDNCDTVVDNGGDSLCDDGDSCSADICNGASGCTATASNLDASGFSAQRIDGRDLEVLASAWNTCPGDTAYNAAANLDQGATPPGSCINDDDFHLFMTVFGHSCP